MIKPPLTVVDPGTNLPSPPRKLGPHGLELWRAVMAEYHIEDPGGRELLAQACSAARSRRGSLATRISEDGAIVHARSGPKPHPALAAELAGAQFRCSGPWNGLG